MAESAKTLKSTPSTVCPPETYQASLDILLGRIAAENPDVVVVEAGGLPLEQYNRDVAIQRIKPRVHFTVLFASDPYAVAGVTQEFGFQRDLVVGVCTSTFTSAGCSVVEELSSLKALNLQDSNSVGEPEQLLMTRLGF